MKFTSLRQQRLEKALTDFLLEDEETINIYNGNDFKAFVDEIVSEVINTILDGNAHVYVLSKAYLDVSYLKVYLTPKSPILIDLDEVWNFTKYLIEEQKRK